MVEILPATPELLMRFWGRPPDRSVRALVLLEAGEPTAVIGIHAEAERWVSFLEVREDARAAYRRRPRPLLEAGRRIQLMAAERGGMPIHALAQDDVEGSARYLEHLGFTPPVNPGFTPPQNGVLYEWRP